MKFKSGKETQIGSFEVWGLELGEEMKSGRDLSHKNGEHRKEETLLEYYTLTAGVVTEQSGDKSLVAGPVMCLSI